MSERIQSVRKEESPKERMMKEHFEKRGLHEKLNEMKFSFKETDTTQQKYEKMVAGAKRCLSPRFMQEDVSAKLQMIEEMSFGFQKIEIERLFPEQGEFPAYLIELLFACGRVSSKITQEKMEAYLPVKVTVKGLGTASVGYSLLGLEIKKKYHNTTRKLSGSRRNFERIWDMGAILADTYIQNSVELFARNNLELLPYLVIRRINAMRKGKTTSIPCGEGYAQDVMRVMDEYGMERNELAKDPLYDSASYRSIFYGEKNEEGYLTAADTPPLKEIALPEMLSQAEYIKEKVRIELEEQSEYARSFETKKNITKKIQEAMESNAFLARYGYVELDNDVDLERFRELEKDFEAFTKQVDVPEAKDHSFRIKKLGKHRAAGLYYPFFRATIFDLDHPDAYAHELAHQIDHTALPKGMLSEEVKFRAVIDSYKTAVEAAVAKLPSDSDFAATWNGRTKYNRAYYFQNTEIFARCFELYLNSKGIKSSFLKENYDTPVYPREQQVTERFTAYFDRLFASGLTAPEPKKENSKVS